MYRRFPIVVYSSFQFAIRTLDLGGVWWGVVVVVCALGDGVDDGGVLFFPSGREHGKVGQDVVLSVAADPSSISTKY